MLLRVRTVVTVPTAIALVQQGTRARYNLMMSLNYVDQRFTG